LWLIIHTKHTIPAPEVLAQEILDNLGVALGNFESIVEELESPVDPK
jgi:hypothetical protein